MPDAVRSLWRLLSAHQRRRLLYTIALMILGAGAEMLTIGALVAFLALLTSTERLPAWAVAAVSLPGAQPAMAAIFLLALAAVLSATLRLALAWHSQHFALEVGESLAARIFRRALRRSYLDHAKGSSSDILSGMEKVQTVIFGILMPILQGMIAAFITLCVAIFLVLLSPEVALCAGAFLAGLYGLVGLVTRRRLYRNSVELASAGQARIKTIQESLGAIRDIVLDRAQPLFEERFQRLDASYRKAQAANLFIGAAPRFIVEAAALVALSAIAVAYSFQAGGIEAAIPLLGALALAGQRLLPLIQQMFTGWSHAHGNLAPLVDVIALADAPLAPEEQVTAAGAVPFSREIGFDAVTFSFGASGFALEDICFAVRKGERLGITGPTGCGKSTLLDLLMGLIEPHEGSILIDGRPLDSRSRLAWRAQIAHVPQAIYLLDDTIIANIAFGRADADISIEEVRAAATAACLDDVIGQLPDGYRTRIGERGVRLSGGQRQRLGIARALYRKLPVLVLDEATNALDAATEARVMRALAARDLTMIVVAHDPATLAICDRVLGFENGKLVASAGGASARAMSRP